MNKRCESCRGKLSWQKAIKGTIYSEEIVVRIFRRGSL